MLTHYGQTLADLEKLQDTNPASEDEETGDLPGNLNFGGVNNLN